MRVTEFMLDLHRRLIEDRKLAESTASKYIKNMYCLNGDQPFKSMAFSKNKEKIDNILKLYSSVTQKHLVASLVSILNMYKKRATYKSIHKHWHNVMMGIEIPDANVMSNKQKQNWMEWDDVVKIKDELKEQVTKFDGNKYLTSKQYDTLLKFIVLCLFVLLPPRRNRDYHEMYVVREYTDKLDKNKNYLDLTNNKFYFNVYKTARKYGQQVLDFSKNKEFKEALKMYMNAHPLNPKKLGKNREFRFLVKEEGGSIGADNAITKLLNRTFKKKVSSSMLRHIYLTSKYGNDLELMKQDAKDMGHSVVEAHKTYIMKEPK